MFYLTFIKTPSVISSLFIAIDYFSFFNIFLAQNGKQQLVMTFFQVIYETSSFIFSFVKIILNLRNFFKSQFVDILEMSSKLFFSLSLIVNRAISPSISSFLNLRGLDYFERRLRTTPFSGNYYSVNSFAIKREYISFIFSLGSCGRIYLILEYFFISLTLQVKHIFFPQTLHSLCF